jgi:hypothetical protein
MDKKIVNRRIAVDAVLLRALTRGAMGRLRNPRRFARIDCPRRKRNQRIAKTGDGFFILGGREARTRSENKDERDSEIHASKLNEKDQVAKATWPFSKLSWQRRPADGPKPDWRRHGLEARATAVIYL